tara:strand:- start:320 stop:679 length:360 start_codon:yes stop_codon:yes gene_type:complete
MKKKTFIYSDLSKKQLQKLKELYIQKKVSSMSNVELKEFVTQIIDHQINDTIDKEEETEAWREMSDFFGEEFNMTILEIKQQYIDHGTINESDEDLQKQRLELLEKNKVDQEKQDMWND